jgi:hypothetical protein
MTPENDLSSVTPDCIAQVLQMSAGNVPLWSRAELAAVLRHQLSAPIEYDLGALPAGAAQMARFTASTRGLLLKSLADLFNHPNPPLELLNLTRKFAKAHRNQPDSPLPAEISTLLYYASTAAALVRCQRRITSLDDDALREGFAWAAGLDWIDEPLVSLFTAAGRLLSPGGPT